MDKIFNQAKDKNVSAVIIYGKKNDPDDNPLAYADEACTIAMKTSELKDAFLKRAIIKIDEYNYIPITSVMEGSTIKVGYITPGGSGSLVVSAVSSVADN